MAISITSPITGSAQTGLSAPTYTNVADVAPGINAKQVAVTALGGTQAGVTVSTVSSPFTLCFWRPANLRAIPAPNPVTGVISNIPRNIYNLVTRKGVTCAANQAPAIMQIETKISVPAGADTYDAANMRAGLSAHIGLLTQQSAGIGDTTNTGVM